MVKFFRGWQRKFGVVTSLAAIALLVLSFTPSTVRRAILVRVNERTVHEFEVTSWGVGWARNQTMSGPLFYRVLNDKRFFVLVVKASPEDESWYRKEQIVWAWNHWGLVFFKVAIDTNSHDAFEHEYWRIPYWSIAIPLILLSAYLFLTTPRLFKQARLPDCGRFGTD
jgi:hypothetical protein